MTVALSSVLFFESVGNCLDTNKESLVCIAMAFVALWLIPTLLIILNFKTHFINSIASMLFIIFQITFWINLSLIIISVPNVKVRIYINSAILLIFIFLVFVIIRYEAKPKFGVLDKKEINNLRSALIELEVAASVMPEIGAADFEQIELSMKSFFDEGSYILHGIDSNILKECRYIRNSALCKDVDAIKLHISILEQLLVLAKQKI